jgi:GNAT superfamily N-acetyltransferase
MSPPPLPDFRLADSSTVDEIGDIIGHAFATDPVSLWACGNAKVVHRGLLELGRELYVRHGMSWFVSGAGGTFWLPPGASKETGLRFTAMMGQVILRHAGPRYAVRALQMDACFQKNRPKTPHYYLFAVGVLPAARGQGLGKALIRHTLREADERGFPTYLENSNPANTYLYQSLGFTPLPNISPAPGCPVVTPMWREPRHSNPVK